jgi:hypothetical protein
MIEVFQKYSRIRSSDPRDEDDAEDVVFESFSATVDYLPARSFPKTKISASFQQFMRFRSTVSMNPTLSFCAIIPNDAKIFDHIKQDDVSAVKSLIEQGEASISDCDPVGRSLLFVCCVVVRA